MASWPYQWDQTSTSLSSSLLATAIVPAQRGNVKPAAGGIDCKAVIRELRQQSAMQAARDIATMLPKCLARLHTHNEAYFYLHPRAQGNEPKIVVYRLDGKADGGYYFRDACFYGGDGYKCTSPPGAIEWLLASSQVEVIAALHTLFSNGLVFEWKNFNVVLADDKWSGVIPLLRVSWDP